MKAWESEQYYQQRAGEMRLSDEERETIGDGGVLLSQVLKVSLLCNEGVCDCAIGIRKSDSCGAFFECRFFGDEARCDDPVDGAGFTCEQIGPQALKDVKWQMLHLDFIDEWPEYCHEFERLVYIIQHSDRFTVSIRKDQGLTISDHDKGVEFSFSASFGPEKPAVMAVDFIKHN